MTPDTALLSVAALQREVEDRVNANAAKSKTPAEDIRKAIAICARDLLRLCRVADMQFASSIREMREESSAFAAFLPELCRPLDELLRNVIRTGADNVGGFSPIEQKELEESRIVTDTVHGNWLCYFQLAAMGAELEPEEYTRRYVRAMREER